MKAEETEEIKEEEIEEINGEEIEEAEEEIEAAEKKVEAAEKVEETENNERSYGLKSLSASNPWRIVNEWAEMGWQCPSCTTVGVRPRMINCPRGRPLKRWKRAVPVAPRIAPGSEGAMRWTGETVVVVRVHSHGRCCDSGDE